MEKNGELTRGLKAIRNKVDNTFWFRDTPHYWAQASLPLAYAVACVEVVCKNSKKASILYNRIVEAWSEAGIRAISDEIASVISDKCADIKGYLKPDVIEADSYVLTTGRTWA